MRFRESIDSRRDNLRLTLKRDFVDTEPWTGSVKKMIIGSLSDEDDAGGGGERSPPETPKTLTFPIDLSRNGTTKSSRFSKVFGRKAQAGPS